MYGNLDQLKVWKSEQPFNLEGKSVDNGFACLPAIAEVAHWNWKQQEQHERSRNWQTGDPFTKA